MLTLPGRQYAARSGASLLQAAGLEGMIAADRADYEAKAAGLAADPKACAALRAELRSRHASAPLFDPAALCRQAESGFEAAFARYLDGRAPDHLTAAVQ